MTVLEQGWQQCFVDLGLDQPPQRVFDELQQRYSEPHRAYHTLQHLEECFGWFAQVRHLTRQPGEVSYALLYHDAIYDPRAHDNEALSAKLAVDALVDSDAGRRTTITNLVHATRHEGVPNDPSSRLLVDIDLSILGAARERFDAYEDQVRFEYAWVPDTDFRDGRSRVLQSFLDRPAIYSTPFFAERLEASARANLNESLQKLRTK